MKGCMKTPILETDRLILRPFYLEDAQEVYECWESDPNVSKYIILKKSMESLK